MKIKTIILSILYGFVVTTFIFPEVVFAEKVEVENEVGIYFENNYSTISSDSIEVTKKNATYPKMNDSNKMMITFIGSIVLFIVFYKIKMKRRRN